MPQRFLYRGALAFLALIAGCQGCPTPLVTNLVTITYHQQANFNHWNLFGQAVGDANDGMMMRYRIISISNKDKNPSVFHFDPNKVSSASGHEKPFAFPLLSGALAFDIAAGTVWTVPLGLTIKVLGNPAELQNQPTFLNYESGPGEHVVMISDSPQAASVPYINPLTQPSQLN